MEVPNEWKSFLISSYIKKEAKIATTRGIAVTSSVRIYGRILKNKIENQYSDMGTEKQAGFRAGRSAVNYLFCIS